MAPNSSTTRCLLKRLDGPRNSGLTWTRAPTSARLRLRPSVIWSSRSCSSTRRVSLALAAGWRSVSTKRSAWNASARGTIAQLVAEEHELWDRESAGEATEADRQRLTELKISLDQCWDLLRQRRALRESGRDPDAADVRRPEVVEHYEQ